MKLTSAVFSFIRSLAVAVAVFAGAWLLMAIGISMFLGSVLSPGLIALAAALGAFSVAAEWFEPFSYHRSSASRSTESPEIRTPQTPTTSPRPQNRIPRIGFRAEEVRKATAPESWVDLAYWPKDAGTQAPRLYRRSPGRNAGQSETSCVYVSPLLGRTVLCESQHERTFFQKFENSGLASSFLEQPVGISYWFDGQNRRYWPDAVVLLRDGRELLVEVKPRALFGKSKDMAKWRAATLWCERNSIGFVVVDPVRGHVLGHNFAQRVLNGKDTNCKAAVLATRSESS